MIETLEESIKQIEMSEYECIAGNLKNNVGWIALKKIIEKMQEIVEEGMQATSWNHTFSVLKEVKELLREDEDGENNNN